VSDPIEELLDQASKNAAAAAEAARPLKGLKEQIEKVIEISVTSNNNLHAVATKIPGWSAAQSNLTRWKIGAIGLVALMLILIGLIAGLYLAPVARPYGLGGPLQEYVCKGLGGTYDTNQNKKYCAFWE
jgi:hypothetical protein